MALLGLLLIVLLTILFIRNNNTEQMIERDKAANNRKYLRDWHAIFMAKNADIDWQWVRTDAGIRYTLFTSSLDPKHISSDQVRFYMSNYGALPEITAEVLNDAAEVCELVLRINSKTDNNIPLYRDRHNIKKLGAEGTDHGVKALDHAITILIYEHYTTLHSQKTSI